METAWIAVPSALAARFRVLEPFAHGDTGSLYLADEPETGRRGVLKILAPPRREQAADRQRLRRELVKQATLQRSALVAPLASGEAEGQTWVFREWLDGVSLEVRLSREGALQQTEALAIAAQIATALDELHRGGLLHRDVKPGHIFLQPTPHGIPRAYLLDAGVTAAWVGPNGAKLQGTLGYLAPEQLGGGLVSFRSDLYSLGCVLYRMLTGRPPFLGETPDEIFTAQRRGEVPPIPAALPNGIAALLQSILSREPQERPFSAQKLRRTLDPFLPDGALMEKQPTSTFETVPAQQPSTAPQASGTLRPPPPPSVRPGKPPGASSLPPPGASSLPPPAPPTVKKALRDPTQQLDLEQVLDLQDLLPEPARPVSSQPPPMPPQARASSSPPSARTTSRRPPPPSDKTQPIRLDQILGIAAARKSAGPPMAAPEPPRPSERPAPEPLFEAPVVESEDEVDEPLAQHAAADDDVTTVLPSRDSESGDEAAVTPSQAAAASAKATLIGIGVDPLAQPAMLPPTPVTSEREHPTDRIEHIDGEDASAAVTGSLPPSALGSLSSLWGDSRHLLMYASAALVGLGVLGVGASALFGGSDEQASVAPPASREEPTAAAAATPAREEQTALAEPPRPLDEPPPSAPEVAEAEEKEGATAEAAESEPAEPAQEAALEARVARAERAAREKDSSSAKELSEAKALALASKREAREERHRLRAERRAAARAAKSETAETGSSAGSSSPKVSQFAEAREQARTHYSAKRYKEAASAFERATQLDPSQAGPFAGLGAARLQIGDNKGAVAAYQKAVQLSPDTSGFHAALGRAYVANGDKSKAIAAYKRALALDPKNAAAKAALAQLGG